jgi:PTS system galactitol-specific IIB component
MRQVRLAVVCGGGIFTTSVVTDEIKKLLDKEGIPYSIAPHKLVEVASLTGFDVIVATGKTSQTNREGTPVLIGLAMFTGMGKEEFSRELVRVIRERVGD